MKKRLLWVDILKGILILLMVVGHATGRFNKYIYQFHMAAFFMISGYTIDYSKRSFARFVYDRFMGLLLPFFSIFLFGTLISCILNGFGVYHWVFPKDQVYIGVNRMVQQLFECGNNYVWWMGACWFVPVLFGALCIQRLLYNAVKSDEWRGVFSILAFLYALSENSVVHISLFSGRLILIAQWYLLIGELARKYRIIEQITERGIRFTVALGLGLLAVFVYAGEIARIQVDWPSKVFASPLEMISVPACDTLLFVLASYYLATFLPWIGNCIAWFGKNSFPIMCFHFLMFKIGNALMVLFGVIPLKEINSFLPPLPNAEKYWVIYVVVSSMGSILLWKTMNRVSLIRILLGKDSRINNQVYERLARVTGNKEKIVSQSKQFIMRYKHAVVCMSMILGSLFFVRGWFTHWYLPSSIDFAQQQLLPERVLVQGWYSHNEGDTFRFVSEDVCVLLKKPDKRSNLMIYGFIPGNFTDVNSMTVYCNGEICDGAFAVTAGEEFRYQTDLTQIKKGTECDIRIVFNTAHQWAEDELDQRKLSACIQMIEFIGE